MKFSLLINSSFLYIRLNFKLFVLKKSIIKVTAKVCGIKKICKTLKKTEWCNTEIKKKIRERRSKP